MWPFLLFALCVWAFTQLLSNGPRSPSWFAVLAAPMEQHVPSYRAMHYIAKRDHAIACRLSICPSWKLIAQTISQTCSLFIAQRSTTYSQENMEKFWGE